MTDPREPLGRLVRQVWVDWAREQPDPKPSWLTGWDDLDAGQREVDMRIGSALANHGRENLRAILRQFEPAYYSFVDGFDDVRAAISGLMENK